MSFGLTPAQQAGYRALIALMGELGRAPTIRELQARMGQKSLTGPHRLLRQLQDRGWINWTKGKNQTIRLTPRAPEALVLPERLKARLESLCAATGDDPYDVVCDAIALHLDEAECQLPAKEVAQ